MRTQNGVKPTKDLTVTRGKGIPFDEWVAMVLHFEKAAGAFVDNYDYPFPDGIVNGGSYSKTLAANNG